MTAESLSIADLVSSLQRGLQKCNELHDGRCQVTPIADRLSQHIPDWVIDTQEYCIVPGNSVTQYAALSYVWNSPLDASGSQATTKRLMLQRNNLNDFRRPGYLAPTSEVSAQLPRVLQDSIGFVQQSGMRYLWVDCLCITQNDETTGDSVRLIKEVYSGSSITIIAAAESSGLYGSGNIDIKKIAKEEHTTEASSLHGALLTSNWATRGWTFQEQLLSKRSFVFLDKTAFWDCQGAVWWYKALINTSQRISICEINTSEEIPKTPRSYLSPFTSSESRTDPDPLATKKHNASFWRSFLCPLVLPWRATSSHPLLSSESSALSSPLVSLPSSSSGRSLPLPTTSRQSSSPSTEVSIHARLSQDLAALSVPNFRLYRELICRYNHRNLTYSEDAMPAISGVINALTQGFPGGFLSGLPVLFLDSSLLWQPLVKAKRRVHSSVGHKMSSPLPSWSWVGWQCLVDPVSLESGLDYEVHHNGNNSFERFPRKTRGIVAPYSRRARKLVDWSASTTLSELYPIAEPETLEQYKGFLDIHTDENLPDGWSRKKGTEIYSNIEISADSNRIRRISRKQPSDWYFHESDASAVFRYPLPMKDNPSTVECQIDRPFLCCMTATAEFNVRRVLRPHKKMWPLGMLAGAPLHVSVLDTKLYKTDHDLETCCPVITLEDSQGRWAGLLRVMDDDTDIEAQQTAEVIAISRGSSSYIEAALTYEETVDRVACCRFGDRNSHHYHFSSSSSLSGSIHQAEKEGEDQDDSSDESDYRLAGYEEYSPGGLRCRLYGGRETKSECYRSMEKEAAELDQGPFFRRGIQCMTENDGLPVEWEYKTYDFYNVLWVQRMEGHMVRKAAGRVPKDIWERNCGALQKIVLG